MAVYQSAEYVRQDTDPAFDTDHKAGETTLLSGVYRCMVCGREIVSEESKLLASPNHHEHTATQGSIRWRMIVFADDTAKS
jgi:hypothetical protein